jgi:hypothetical protein
MMPNLKLGRALAKFEGAQGNRRPGVDEGGIYFDAHRRQRIERTDQIEAMLGA